MIIDAEILGAHFGEPMEKLGLSIAGQLGGFLDQQINFVFSGHNNEVIRCAQRSKALNGGSIVQQCDLTGIIDRPANSYFIRHKSAS